MKEESHNPWTDPELEARIVALVLGEASDFEREELNRLIEERPELAAFKEQIQGVHGLLLDVATGELVAADDDWKLSAEKRSTVLAVISGETQEQPAKQVVTKSAEKPRSVKGNPFWNLTKIAAVFCVVGFVGSMTIPAFFNGVMSDFAQNKQPGLAMHDSHSTESTVVVRDQWPVKGEASAPRTRMLMSNGAATVTADEEYLRTAKPAAVAGFDHERNSQSALSAIRGTLDADGVLPSPWYLTDDVQYFSAEPEFKLSRGEALNRAPTAGVNGPGPGLSRLAVDVDEVTGVTGMITLDERNFALEQFGEGDRPTDPQPNVPSSGNGELSFPMLAVSPSDRNASEPAAPVRSTVSIADGGTVLLGGIKRMVEGRTEHRVAGEPTVSSTMGLHDYSGFEGKPQDVASSQTAALGLSDGPVPEGESGSSTDFAGQALGSQDSGQEQNFSGGQRRLRGGTEFRVPNGLEDSLDAGEGIVADGEISAGSGGNSQTDDRMKGISEEYEPEDVAEGEFDAWRKTRELADTAPSRPMTGGMGGGAGRVASQNSPRYGSSDSKPLDSGKLANSLPSPPTKPVSPSEDSKSKENLAVAENRKEEEVTTESVNMPSVDDIAIHDGRGLGRNPSFSIPVPEPLTGKAAAPHGQTDRRYLAIRGPNPATGTAIGQPLGESGAGLAKQESHWGYDQDSDGYSGRGKRDSENGRLPRYRVEDPEQPATITRGYDSRAIEKRVEDSLEKLSELSSLYENTEIAEDPLADGHNKHIGQFWHRPQSELEGAQYELLRQRGQLATSGRSVWNGYVPPMLVDNSESMKTWGVQSPVPAGLNENSAEEEAFSTYSLHVSDVSFKLARAALASGQWPEAARIRVEEFVNAFDYGDPMPTQSERVSCRLEQSIHPFLQQRNLLRISMRTAAAGRSSNTPLRLTLLLDNSGSMERIDRQQTVRRAFALLTQQLKPIDQVTLISFARQPRLLADKVSGDHTNQLVQLIADLPSEGGTNIEAALQLAFEKAKEQQVDGAQNRIILLTDGAVNLGDANPESLSRMITAMRHAGIAFDAAGISAEGLNDEILEALTRKGDGRYYLLDSLETADHGFARQIAGALRPSAKNVKVQIEFNPKRVGRYKLLGFEKHRLKQEDFRNDKVDAAEMAAAEAGVAVYQFEAKPDGHGDVGSVSVRFQDLSTGEMIENRWPIPYEADAPRPDQAAPSLRIATSAALLAAKLRGEPLGDTVDLKTLSDLIAGLPDRDRNADRVQQLQRMIQQARQVCGG